MTDRMTVPPTTSTLPPPPPRDLRDRLAACKNAIERTPGGKRLIAASRHPTGELRTAFEARRAQLRAEAGSHPDEIARRVARLFVRFPQSKPSADQMQMTLAAYAADLRRFPTWAIDQAITHMLATEARAFMPSSLELRAAVERAYAPIAAELADLDLVLTAEPAPDHSPEGRAKLRALLSGLRAELAAHADPLDRDPRRPLTRPEAQDWLARQDPTAPPPGFSPALRALLARDGHVRPEPDAREER